MYYFRKSLWLSFGIGIGVILMSLFNKASQVHKFQNEGRSYSKLEDHINATGNLSLISSLFKYGNPEPISDLRCFKEYIVSYNRMLRNPNFAIEKLTKDVLEEKDTHRSNIFLEDLVIPKMFRSRSKDYLYSGYDRGHLAPAADFAHDQTSMDQSFYMSNMSPQVGVGFNRHYWFLFEKFVRHITAHYKEIYVITGPLFLPKKLDNKYYVTYEMIGNPPNIAVPTHFFKVILAVSEENKFNLQGFVLPNKEIDKNTQLKEFIVNIEIIEKSSGLSFYDKLGEKRYKENQQICLNIKCELSLKNA